MNRITKYIIFTFLLTFIFMFNVKAECSYQERKDLLNLAKNIDISVEPIEVSVEKGNYDFKFNIANINEDIFIKYYNTNNGAEKYIRYEDTTNGLYSFIDEASMQVYDYKFVFYSNNNNCIGYKLTTKTLKKPMYNIYSENVNCTNDIYQNFKYCNKFLDKDDNLSLEEFYEKMLDYSEVKTNNNVNKNENNSNENKLLSNIIIITIILIVLTAAVIIFIMNKKRSEKL